MLQDDGIRSTAPVTGVALAIKADPALPWSKLRSLRRWLKTFGVCLESENSIKDYSATQLPAYTARDLLMVKKKGEVWMAATIFFPHLVEIVMFFLNKLEEYNQLQWNGIPQSEIWVKIGGEHGGETFKLSFPVRIIPQHTNTCAIKGAYVVIIVQMCNINNSKRNRTDIRFNKQRILV